MLNSAGTGIQPSPPRLNPTPPHLTWFFLNSSLLRPITPIQPHRINVTVGPHEKRMLITGMHTVADIYCLECEALLGWKYQEAFEESQKYKVRALLQEEREWTNGGKGCARRRRMLLMTVLIDVLSIRFALAHTPAWSAGGEIHPREDAHFKG